MHLRRTHACCAAQLTPQGICKFAVPCTIHTQNRGFAAAHMDSSSQRDRVWSQATKRCLLAHNAELDTGLLKSIMRSRSGASLTQPVPTHFFWTRPWGIGCSCEMSCHLRSVNLCSIANLIFTFFCGVRSWHREPAVFPMIFHNAALYAFLADASHLRALYQGKIMHANRRRISALPCSEERIGFLPAWLEEPVCSCAGSSSFSSHGLLSKSR